MPISWKQKIDDPQVIKWAYDHYVRRDVLWAGDRQSEGYPIVAEFPIFDEDIE